MKISASLSSLALATLFSRCVAVTLSFDPAFDDASRSIDTVACASGDFGLKALGYTTFGSLPGFPRIGGTSEIAGFNSPNCGTCWKLTYTNARKQTKSINIIAIDHTKDGFNTALGALNELTGGRGEELGRINVEAKQLAASDCGLRA